MSKSVKLVETNFDSQIPITKFAQNFDSSREIRNREEKVNATVEYFESKDGNKFD